MSGLQRQLVRHEGQEFELWQNGAQDERRVLDLDLARWAGASNPSNIVALIDRHGPDLRDLGDLYAVEIAAPARGGKGRTAVYLNEPQALYLLAKMETPRARSTLKLMIVVFVKAVHGDHYPQAAELEDLRARVERLEARSRSARRPTGAPRVPRPPKDELVKRVKDALGGRSAPCAGVRPAPGAGRGGAVPQVDLRPAELITPSGQPSRVRISDRISDTGLWTPLIRAGFALGTRCAWRCRALKGAI